MNGKTIKKKKEAPDFKRKQKNIYIMESTSYTRKIGKNNHNLPYFLAMKK